MSMSKKNDLSDKQLKKFRSLSEMEFDILKKDLGEKIALDIILRAKADMVYCSEKEPDIWH